MTPKLAQQGLNPRDVTPQVPSSKAGRTPGISLACPGGSRTETDLGASRLMGQTGRDNPRHALIATTSMYLHGDDAQRARQLNQAFAQQLP